MTETPEASLVGVLWAVAVIAGTATLVWFEQWWCRQRWRQKP